jgi:hypothetical protein
VATWIAIVMSGDRAPQRPGGTRLILVLLLLLPGVQALGTGNALPYLAVNGFALWTVVLLRVWVEGPGIRRGATAVAVTTMTAVVAWVAVTGMLAGPYRTASLDENASPVVTGSTGKVQLERATARAIDDLRSKVPAGSPIMAFDEMAGIVLLLDGYPVGEPWYSSSDHQRTAMSITDYCDESDDPWAQGQPLIIANRPLTAVENDALRACGLSLTINFRHQPSPGLPATGPLDLYLPREDE